MQVAATHAGGRPAEPNVGATAKENDAGHLGRVTDPEENRLELRPAPTNPGVEKTSG